MKAHVLLNSRMNNSLEINREKALTLQTDISIGGSVPTCLYLRVDSNSNSGSKQIIITESHINVELPAGCRSLLKKLFIHNLNQSISTSTPDWGGREVQGVPDQCSTT